MFKRVINILILVPVAIILIVLSVANRQTATLALNPFNPSDSVLSVSAPFFVFIFLALMIGMLLGSIATWFKQGKHRKNARNNQREAVKWHTEADKLKEESKPASDNPGLVTLSGPSR